MAKKIRVEWDVQNRELIVSEKEWRKIQRATGLTDKEIDKVNRDLRRTQQETKKVKGGMEGMSSTLKKIGGLMAAAFAIGRLKAFADETIRLADVQQKAERQLLIALKGRSDIQQRLIKQAQELQGKTLFGDEETIRAQSLIAAFVKEEAAIKKVIPLVQDLATAKGMDLAGAADLVSKTLGSSTNALSRYGIQVTGAVGSSQRLESLTNGLTKAFGGQAEAAAKVGAGPLTQLKNVWGDIKEAIGGALLTAITPLVIYLRDNLPKIIDWFKGVRVTAIGVANSFIDLYNESTLFRGSVELIKISFKNTWDLVKLFFNNLLDNLKTSGKVLKLVFTGQFKEALKELKKGFTDTLSNYKDFGRDVAQNYIDGFNNTFNQKKKIELISLEPTQKEEVISDFGELGIDSAKSFVDSFVDNFKIEEIKNAFTIEDIAGAFQDEVDKMNEEFWDDQFKKTKEAIAKDKEERLEAQKERLETEREIQNQTKQLAADAGNAIFDMRKNMADKELNVLSMNMQKELEIAEGNAKKQKDIKEKFAKEEARIKQKMAKLDKQQALFNVAIKTAENIVKFLGNPVLVGLAIASGAIQSAVIASQPIPKFKKGGKIGGKRHEAGGTIIEAEVDEYVIRRDAALKAPRLLEKINTLQLDDRVLDRISRNNKDVIVNVNNKELAELLKDRPVTLNKWDENGFSNYWISKTTRIQQQHKRFFG